jgi:DnaK suppressor protein
MKKMAAGRLKSPPKGEQKALIPKAKRKATLGRNLTNLRKKLLAELGEEFCQHVSPEVLSKVDQVIEEGDLAQRNVDEDINLQVLEIKSRDLRRIDRALVRLKAGDYGQCQNCGSEIGEKRLEVLPFADLCFTCQQDKENRQSSRDLTEVYES